MDLYNHTVGRIIDCEQFNVFRNVAAVVGVLYVSKVFLKELWNFGDFCSYFLALWGVSRPNVKKYGEWAVVTGASEGIGRGYALELARQGLNVVIMSRSREKLDKVADEIKTKYGRDVKVLPVDFSGGQDIYPQIADELKDLDIGMLVNNVGLFYDHPDYFTDIPELHHQKMIEINCQALVQMTHLVLPKMVERKRGAIVNISSMIALLPAQYVTIYAASKIFVNYFSDALRKEYASKGIEVQTVMPGVVVTAMAMGGGLKPNLMLPDGNRFARSAVATIGRQTTTFGFWSHAIQGSLMSRLPLLVMNPLLSKGLLDVRAEGLKKKAKQQ